VDALPLPIKLPSEDEVITAWEGRNKFLENTVPPPPPPLAFQTIRGNRPQDIIISLLVSVWRKELSRAPISTREERVFQKEFSRNS
jgi:hypothetical protein